MNVEPEAPVIRGKRALVFILLPNSVSTLTFGKTQSSGAAAQTGRNVLGTVQVTLDSQCVIIDPDVSRVGTAGSDRAEIARIQQSATQHAAEPRLALSLAVGAAQGAEARLGRIGPIGGSHSIVLPVQLDHDLVLRDGN